MGIGTAGDIATFEGRVALVTGGSRGIGFGIASTLLRRGATVFVNGTDEHNVAEAVNALGGPKARARPLLGDVSDSDDVERMVKEAEAELGRIDILVNNAGVQVVKGVVEHTIEDWDRVVAVNLRAVFLCTRAVLPGMIRAGRGSIINIASIAAMRTTTPHASYAAAKAGVIAFTRDVAYEVAPHGVRVNGIAPGPIDTPMIAAIMTPEKRDAITRAVPVGRWGDPEDVGAAVAFLASDEAAFVTGVMLPVAGGADLRLAF